MCVYIYLSFSIYHPIPVCQSGDEANNGHICLSCLVSNLFPSLTHDTQEELTPTLNTIRLRRQLKAMEEEEEEKEEADELITEEEEERLLQEEQESMAHASVEDVAPAAAAGDGFSYHPINPADGPATVYVEDGLEFCGTCNVDSVSQ